VNKPVFPVALVLENRTCLVVGSGLEAARRAEKLLDAGAAVTVVAAAAAAELDALALAGRIRLERRAFDDTDLDDAWLAVLTERDTTLAARMAAAAEQRRVLFAALDQPSASNFFHVAIARAGALLVAISTSSKAPALGRRLREELERVMREAGLEAFVERLSLLRENTPSGERARVLGRAVAGLRLTGKLELPDIEP
jgi:siroheme synthase-like protein